MSEWEDISLLIASKLSFRIVHALHFYKHLTPKQISKVTNIARSNVSTKLSILRKRGLVKCVTPERKKGRIYVLTERGLKVMEKIKNTFHFEELKEYTNDSNVVVRESVWIPINKNKTKQKFL